MEATPEGDLSQYVNAPLLQKSSRPLEGQWAFITGATRFNGLGFAAAERLALEGASIIIVGTENSRGIAPLVVRRLMAYGVEAHSLVGDVTQEESCREMIAEAYTIANGNVDILVNNAGTNRNKPITDVTLEDYHYVYDPKALGALLMSHEWFNPRIRKNLLGGRVVNIGSPVGSLYGNYGQVPYAMANGALFGLTQSLALEFGTRGVTVNLVAPTFVPGTEMTKDMEAQIPAIKATTPNSELPTPQDIGGAVAYLAGSDGGAINSIVLPIDVGMKSNYTALRPLGRARFRQVSQAGLRIAGDLTKEEVDVILEMRRQKEAGQNG